MRHSLAAPWLFWSAISTAVLSIAACTPSGKVGAPVPMSAIPEGLKDCQFYVLENGMATRYHIVRCPNSSASLTMPGKHPEYTSTIEASAPAASAPVSAIDTRMLQIDANIARTEMTIKRLQLERAELERDKLK
jgi:hypothetical protein